MRIWNEVALQSLIYMWQLGGQSRCHTEFQPPLLVIHFSLLWSSQEYGHNDE